MHKIIIILALVLAPTLAAAEADPSSKCYDLQRAVDEARARYIAEDLERMQQTVLQPVPSLAETSCLDSFSAGIDITKYDPAAILEMLKQQAKREVCNAANGFLRDSASQISNAGALPYGLGRINVGSSAGSRPAIQTPKVPLPF